MEHTEAFNLFTVFTWFVYLIGGLAVINTSVKFYAKGFFTDIYKHIKQIETKLIILEQTPSTRNDPYREPASQSFGTSEAPTAVPEIVPEHFDEMLLVHRYLKTLEDKINTIQGRVASQEMASVQHYKEIQTYLYELTARFSTPAVIKVDRLVEAHTAVPSDPALIVPPKAHIG